MFISIEEKTREINKLINENKKTSELLEKEKDFSSKNITHLKKINTSMSDQLCIEKKNYLLLSEENEKLKENYIKEYKENEELKEKCIKENKELKEKCIKESNGLRNTLKIKTLNLKNAKKLTNTMTVTVNKYSLMTNKMLRLLMFLNIVIIFVFCPLFVFPE